MAMAMGVCTKVLQPVGLQSTTQRRGGGGAPAAEWRQRRVITRRPCSRITSYGTTSLRPANHGSSATLLCGQAAAASASSSCRRSADRHCKIVARTQQPRRGARHGKDSKPPADQNADYQLLDDLSEEEDDSTELPEDEAAAIPVETAKASYVGDKWVAVEEEGDRSGENLNQQFQQYAEDAAETTSEAVDDSSRSVRKTGQRLGRNLEETRKEGESIVREGAEAINKQAGRAGSDIQEGMEEAGETARKLAGLAQESAEESGQQVRELGDEIRGNIEGVGEEGEKLMRKGGEAVGAQAREAADRVGKQAQRLAPEGTDRSVRRIGNRAERASERVQAPIQRAVDASLEAAEAVGKEAFGVGQTLLETAQQATGMAGRATMDGRQAGQNASRVQQQREVEGQEDMIRERKYKPAGRDVMRKFQGMGAGAGEWEFSQGKENADSYTGLKVLVAGASGRTGRLIVENLTSKGVPVRALVRDVNKARRIKQLEKAELVVGDLYKYETLKQALGDSNVVICASGAQGFTLDLLQTYKTEYEGVVNLVSAAKNQGDVKKFVFITTIGVSFLQIIPLLFWKRQAELFLQRSGLDYTILRPGGLRNDSGMNESVQLRPADSQFIGAVSRRKVAEVCATALVTPESSEKVVEIVAGSGRGRREIEDQFATI